MHAHHMMQDGSSVLLVTIKGAQKLVRLGDDKHGYTYTWVKNVLRVISLSASWTRIAHMDFSHTELKAFGKIPTRKLVGLPYGLAFELVDNSTIRVLSREEVLALRGAAGMFKMMGKSLAARAYPSSPPYEESAEENGANNREIVDAGTAQRLSQEDIEVMKQRVLKGDMAARELVTSVAQSNAVFVTRTEFSQQKYLDRKTRK